VRAIFQPQPGTKDQKAAQARTEAPEKSKAPKPGSPVLLKPDGAIGASSGK
jgi:hypothetical protein